MVGTDPRSRRTDDQLFASRYRLGAVLGRGGMADVVRADDETLGRSVAVKIFRDGEPAGTAQRIDAEIRTLASLSHPGLVRLYDAGVGLDTSGAPVPYLVMELIDGPTLDHYRRGRALHGPFVARIGRELAEALAYIHDRGVVHRDIKPANILVVREPDIGVGQCVKLADFGIARIVDAERLTEHGTTIGTAHYLSPEQATGTSAGPPTDIYTLGLVLIECLTGTMAFEGSAVAAAVARLHRDPVVPGGLGPEWHSLLTDMTSRQPTDRPTATTVAHRLSRLLLAGAPLPATMVLPDHSASIAAAGLATASISPDALRRRWTVPMAAMLVLILGAAIIWLASTAGDESVESPAPPSTTTPSATMSSETPPAAPAAPAPAPDAQTLVPAFSDPPEVAPAATSDPVPIEPVAPQAPAAPPGNGNGNGNSGNENGNSGKGNGNSGRGN